jgi:MFS family permease
MPVHLRRNYWLGVISGIAYNFYIAVLSTELVLTWFLSELTDSNLLISLLVPIEMGSWLFLQLLLSGYVQRWPRALPLYRVMAGVRVIALILLSLATFVLDGPGVLLVVFMVTFTVNSVAAGVAALPFLNVVAKTIPPTRRGMYFGWRRFVGGLLGLSGGALVKLLLSPGFPLSFPDNYGLLFVLGCLITIVLVGTFSFVKEPEEVVDPQRVRLSEQLRRAARLPAHDHSYRRYLGLRVAIVAANYALPFYAVYARRTLNAPDDMVGVYLIGLTLAGVLSNLILGQLGDRRGNRLLMRVVALSATLPPVLALLIGHLPEVGLEKSVLFIMVFVLQGVHRTAGAIGSNNYVLELAPSIQRVLYLGFANGVVGLILFMSPVSGLVVDWLGFEPLFAFSLACSLIAVMLSLGLDEPRKRQAVAKATPASM